VTAHRWLHSPRPTARARGATEDWVAAEFQRPELPGTL